MVEVTFVVSDMDLADLKGPVPPIVQLRIKMNEAGFRFEDDRQFSLITNTKPVPLGSVSRNYDHETHITAYKQVIS